LALPECRQPLPATLHRRLHRCRHHPCRVDIPRLGLVSREHRALVLVPSQSGRTQQASIRRIPPRALYADSLRWDRLDQARVIVLDVAHACLPRSTPRIYQRGRSVECLQRSTSMTFWLIPKRFVFPSVVRSQPFYTSINRQQAGYCAVLRNNPRKWWVTLLKKADPGRQSRLIT
jgi:hypothetical protein